MRLLRTLTLSYVVVLVVALVSSLTTIWVYLRRIADALSDIHDVLLVVRDRTAPLDEPLQRLQDAFTDSAEVLEGQAQASLARADERLTGVAEQINVPERAG